MNTGVIEREGYLGGTSWVGVNRDRYRRYSEINKIVKKAFKEKYPNTKVSCTGESFSGGQSCRGVLFFALDDMIHDYDTFVKNCKDLHYYCGDYRWVNNVPADRFTLDELYKYAYECFIRRLSGGVMMTHPCDEAKAILKPHVLEQLSYLSRLYDSLNDYDVNSQVDYFDVDFYKDIELKAL